MSSVLLALCSRLPASDLASFDSLNGKIFPPHAVINFPYGYAILFNSWKPLDDTEIKEDPVIDYFGPNLTKLDLSELSLVWSED